MIKDLGQENSKKIHSTNIFPIAWALLITLVIGILTPYILNKTETWPNCYYLQTSRLQFGVPESPWAYRLLKPLIAGLMPGDEAYSFIVLTYLALFIGLLGIFELSREAELNPKYRYLAMVLYGFSYTFRKALVYPWMLDDWNMMFLIFGLIFIYRDQILSFSVILAIGVLNHEHAFFLIPIFLLSKNINYWKNNWIRCLGAVLPSLLIFIAIRIIIPIPNSDYFSYYLSYQNIKACYAIQGGISNIVNLVYGTFGFIWVTSALALWKCKLNLIERTTIFMVPLSCFQLAFGCDTSRLVAINLPLLLIVSLKLLERLPAFWSFFAGGSFIFRSLARFAGISIFHPKWLLVMPTLLITLIELIFCLILILMLPRYFKDESV